jgi:hypothetical protein
MDKMTNVKALVYVLDNYTLPADVADKIKAMKTSYEKKSTNRKPTKTQVANDNFKTAVYDFLTTVDRATIADICANVYGLDGASPQKISSLLKPFIDAGQVERIKDKKVTYYALVKDSESDNTEDTTEVSED